MKNDSFSELWALYIQRKNVTYEFFCAVDRMCTHTVYYLYACGLVDVNLMCVNLLSILIVA